MKRLLACSLAFASLQLVATSTQASELPQPKAGSWETTMQMFSDGKPVAAPRVMKSCLGSAASAKTKREADAYVAQNCSRNESRKEGAKWITERVCKLGDSTVTTRGVTEFLGTSTYKSDTESRMSPALGGRKHTRVVLESKWQGPCKS